MGHSGHGLTDRGLQLPLKFYGVTACLTHQQLNLKVEAQPGTTADFALAPPAGGWFMGWGGRMPIAACVSHFFSVPRAGPSRQEPQRCSGASSHKWWGKSHFTVVFWVIILAFGSQQRDHGDQRKVPPWNLFVSKKTLVLNMGLLNSLPSPPAPKQPLRPQGD